MTTSARTSPREGLDRAASRSQRSAGRPNGGRACGSARCTGRRRRSVPPERLRRDVHVVPERRESLGDGLHVDRSAERARDDLIEAPYSSASLMPAPACAGSSSQREERPGLESSEQPDIEHHQRGQATQRHDTSARLGADAPWPPIAPRARPAPRVHARVAREALRVMKRSAIRTRTFSTNAPAIGV